MTTPTVEELASDLAKAGARHGKTDKQLVQALHTSASKLVDCAMCAMPDANQKAALLIKAGARHARADMLRIKAIHDAAVELGATCPEDNLTKD